MRNWCRSGQPELRWPPWSAVRLTRTCTRGGFYEWDTAAPVAVARAAGYYASRIDGSALAYNQANLLMPDILVCRPALAGTLLQAIREVTNAS